MKTLTLLSFICLTIICFGQSKTAALEFDGTNDVVTVAHNSSLDLGLSAFTIEAWIRADTTTAILAPVIVGKKGDGANANGFLFGLSDRGYVAMEVKGIGVVPFTFSGKDLRDDQCHHIAWTREVAPVQDTMRAYIDGVYVNRSRKAIDKLDISNTDDLTIGWTEFFQTTPNYPFAGMIKEIRIWNIQRSESDIQNTKNRHLIGNESGLVAYWRLNENSGQNIIDFSPNGNNGMVGTTSSGDANDPTWAVFCDILDDIPGGGPTGVARSTTASMSIYPNPTSDQLFINFGSDVPESIMVYDAKGRLIISETLENRSSIDVQNLRSGLYFVRIASEGQVLLQQSFMKE